MTDLSLWSQAIWLCHVMIYLSASAVIGGLFCHWLVVRAGLEPLPNIRYLRFGALIGLVVTVVFFFVRVGEAADEGLAGFTDAFLIDLLWNNAVGDATKALFIGFFLALITSFVNRTVSIMRTLLGWLSVLSLGTAFAVSGHTAAQPLVAQLAIALHIIVALGWLGALPPLWRLTRQYGATMLFEPMTRFGQIAPIPIALLVCAGLWISYRLTEWHHLFDSLYGNLLLLKALGLVLLLGFGALHKWRLVPALKTGASPVKLQGSLMLEALVGLIVLMATALLTGVTGPHL